jgi:hypothetical protein
MRTSARIRSLAVAMVLAAAVAAGRPALGLIEDVMQSAAGAARPVPSAPPVTVVVRGQSAISSDDARQQALREAVERVCGVYVRSDSRTENLVLTLDQVYTKAAGFGQVEVLNQGQRDGVYWVIARVTVSEVPIVEMLRQAGLLRQWRIAVLIPETHLQRPRIPDPAAETAVIRALTGAGYRVVDRDFSGRYRYDSLVTQAWRGDVSALRALLATTKADVLVIGEAFSQRPPRDPTELPQGIISCRARVELRAVSKATSEILTADSAEAGGLDMSEEIAGKVALERAADEVGARLSERLMLLPAASTRQIEVVITGVHNASQARQMQEAIKRLSGVRRVEQDELSDGELYLDAEADALTADGLASALEKAIPGLAVGEASKLMIRAVWHAR